LSQSSQLLINIIIAVINIITAVLLLTVFTATHQHHHCCSVTNYHDSTVQTAGQQLQIGGMEEEMKKGRGKGQ